MWSLGVLTACLFTGDTMIPHEDLVELSQVEIAGRFLGMNDEYARGQWLDIPKRALKFIQRLLVIDPERRMSIDEALDHSWYTRPRSESEALNDALKRLTRFWKPREKGELVTEDLPGVLNNHPLPEQPVVKLYKKVPDASLSPYFGLDRHLQPRLPSTRKRILDDLSESGSQFVTSKEPTEKRTENCVGAWRIRGASSIRSVEGRDLFEMSCENKSYSPVEYDLEEVDQISTASRPGIERSFGFNFSGQTDSSTSPSFAEAGDIIEITEIPAKRTRKSQIPKPLNSSRDSVLSRSGPPRSL
jgi:serine/threonine protein kinase